MAVVAATRIRPRARRRAGASVPLRGLLPLVVLLMIWQLAGSDGSLSLPRPSTWWDAITGMNDEGVLVPALLHTLWTFLLSLLAATVIGTLLGLAIGASATLNRALGPLLDFLRTLPPPAIIPVAVLLLGATLQMSVVVVVLAIVWPILFNVAASMRAVPPVRLDMARSLGLRRGERFFKVVLPSVAPGIALGVRISVSISLVVTLLVDILGSGDGAGRLIVVRQQTFDAPAVWGLLAIIGVFGYVINAGVVALERRALRNWPEGT
jgi:ABC-type nitrate/sulfonate/bicarbonate transport system permease component